MTKRWKAEEKTVINKIIFVSDLGETTEINDVEVCVNMTIRQFKQLLMS